MNDISEAFARMEAMICKHAPLLMRVGDYVEPREAKHVGLPAKWKPPTHANTIAKMRRLRSQGMTIGEIARKCKVGWQTAWLHSKGRA